MSKRKIGTCLLSGCIGPLVDCHIIPKALTSPQPKGEPLFQTTKGKGLKKRFSSWYDKSIVTREGEDILARIDNDAIKALRKHQLIWKSWVIFCPVFENFGPSTPDHSFRLVQLKEQAILARFFASIAWRASVSKIPDMDGIALGTQIESELRDIILNGTDTTAQKYRVSLIQISSIGERHNMTPILDSKAKNLDDPEGEKIEFVRIYFDGLIAHLNLSALENQEQSSETSNFLEAGKNLLIPAIQYQATKHFENLLFTAAEVAGPISWAREEAT
ncbi:hypothetical protein JQV53_00475 [Sulfitobacter geojensis]|uniref:hypothetical protein n=1 Tax=Sulfitobacter geojensis TaxID=1342299 RepID=UPI00193A90B6|nr:hypothetical protein [Sulfitobacter geojensis]MBM1760819.1 hypothetical protein [Sulfitobacter geojensis]MBM1773022.1 hypothetical protein [Sulfitobacter geojensis]MBM1778471.1 hypothetical protein [Sulfitobacter geojensis]MBM1792054.1 hypothetical protein [Sulfitobacter geojensis]MBM1793343.1 hypothetical protein [Sulfitobacter geojensis]